MHQGSVRYRILAAHPWPAEGANALALSILTSDLEGRVIEPDTLAEVVQALGAELATPAPDSLLEGAPNGKRRQAVIIWCGHHYDLDLEMVVDDGAPWTLSSSPGHSPLAHSTGHHIRSGQTMVEDEARDAGYPQG